MKLHPPLVRATVHALTEIFKDNRHADKVIESLLKSNPKWGARDRAFIAESVYEIVRFWRRYWAIMGREPDYHHISLWHLFGVYWKQKGFDIPNWDEFKGAKSLTPEKIQALKLHPEIWQAYPNWMFTRLIEELGKESATQQMLALNQQADVILRANTLQTSAANLQLLLEESGIATEFIDNHPSALLLTERQSIFRNPLFLKGFFEVQDANSQLIAPFLAVEPGMRVIDACAGAGGKSLHIAALMKNKGRLISMDIEAYKLEETKKRARRAGVSILETRLIEGTKTIKRLKEMADRVLLDVPCSGMGVLRRNPDAKWKLSPEFLANLLVTQKNILQTYAQMTKKGGILVYATCSIFNSENRQQVDIFLANNPNFELIEDKLLLPFESGFDGFYMAKMRRKTDLD